MQILLIHISKYKSFLLSVTILNDNDYHLQS
ncbi:hypothetical protein [Citrobacter phage Tr1]|nr:hypothetical protein [Citrobacter phage Tr1]